MRCCSYWFTLGLRPLSTLLLVFFLVGWGSTAWAGSSTAYKCAAPANTTIKLPDINVPAGTASGPIGTPSSVTVTFDCSAAFFTYYNPGGVYKTDGNFPTVTVQAGMLAARDPTPPLGGGIMFALTGTSGLSGIALQLTAAPNQADSGNGGPGGTAGWDVGTASRPNTSFSATFEAQWVKTGPVNPGTIDGLTLAQFTDYNPGYTTSAIPYFASLSLAAGSRVTVPSCNSSVMPSQTVILPTISTSALATGRAAGASAFSIALSGCPAGVTNATAYFESAATIDTTTGNLMNSNGTASNVEVQLLNGAGSSDASPGSAIVLSGAAGAQNSGTFPITGGSGTMNYYAQYVATGAGAGPGSVKTSVMFTINYP